LAISRSQIWTAGVSQKKPFHTANSSASHDLGYGKKLHQIFHTDLPTNSRKVLNTSMTSPTEPPDPRVPQTPKPRQITGEKLCFTKMP